MLNQSQLPARLEREAAHLAEELHLVYVDTEIVKEPTGRYLRIYLDKEGGISLDELEAFHKQIRALAEDIDYDYMEVSSPGADRPLKKPADFERALGMVVELKLYTPVNGVKQFKGELAAYSGGDITLATEAGEMLFRQKDVAIVRPYIDVDKELEQANDI